jgi:hypothetical protein
MPRTFYTNETDIPADQKGAYTQKNGRWELTDLDDEHPVVVAKKSLETTQTTLKTANSDLQQKLTIAETKVLGDGMVAVAPEVKELGETAQNLGLKKTDIPSLKTRAEAAETKLTQKEKSELDERVAAAAGKNPNAWKEHATANGLTYKEKTEKDEKGSETVSFVVVTKGDDNKEVETPLKDYVEKKASHVASAVAEKPRKGFNFPKEKGVPETGNQFDAIREKVKEEVGVTQNNNLSFAEKFYGTSPAASQK